MKCKSISECNDNNESDYLMKTDINHVVFDCKLKIQSTKHDRDSINDSSFDNTYSSQETYN